MWGILSVAERAFLPSKQSKPRAKVNKAGRTRLECKEGAERESYSGKGIFERVDILAKILPATPRTQKCGA